MITMHEKWGGILEMVHLNLPQMMQGEALYPWESSKLQRESFPDSLPLMEGYELEELLATGLGSSFSKEKPLQGLRHIKFLGEYPVGRRMKFGEEYLVVSHMNNQKPFPAIPRMAMTIQELFPESPRPTIFEKSLQSAQTVIQGTIPAPSHKLEQTTLPVHTQEPVKQMFLAIIQKKAEKIIAARKLQRLTAILSRLHLLQIQSLTFRRHRSYVMRP